MIDPTAPGLHEQSGSLSWPDELRALLRAVHERRLDDDDGARLAEALAAARATLGGTRRPPWYEDETEGGRDTWRRTSLFRGTDQALAPPLRVERAEDAEGPFVIGTVTCGRMYEGPPGAVHGGYLAGVFDDLLGAALSLVEGPSGVTGRLTVRYRRPTPLDHPLRFEARPVDVRRRWSRLVARCLVDGAVTAEAEGLFLRRDLAP